MLLMLRNRSREVASKQPRNSMADHPSFLPSPKQNQTKPISSFLGSPRFFNGFLIRTLSDSESQSSPISILDVKNPFGYYDKKLLSLSNNNTCLENGNKHIYEKIDGIGLALLDSLIDDENFTKSNNSKMVLFGAKILKLQIPSLPTSLDDSTPKSPADFGIKTRNSQFLNNSLSASFGSPNSSSVKFSKSLSFSEMELSEEYTCVITHGPNPKTTHIFDDCIVESCCGVGSLCELKKEYGISSSTHSLNPVPVSFLRFCYTCKNQLGDGKDIYMYRGEKAFCSHECRCQEMLIEEEVKNPKSDEFSMA